VKPFIDKDQGFNYPCGYQRLVEAKATAGSGESTSGDPFGYLEKHGLINSDEHENSQSDPRRSWELLVLSNLLNGRDLFIK